MPACSMSFGEAIMMALYGVFAYLLGRINARAAGK